MPDCPKSTTIAAPRSVAEKAGAFCWFVLSTLLMLEMREALDAATGGDKSDAGFKQGL